ncbi:MAG: hypothetical protein HKN87_23590 [Saprospiraceae bacterium]|nr:hypothetical protein [Saprospiraceae bacterium]
MLELFRKNLFIYNIFLLLYLILLRISWFFIDAPIFEMKPGILSRYLYQAIGIDSLLIKFFAIALIIFQAIQINRVVALNRLTSINSLFPGLFYVLLTSLSINMMPLYPALLANTFIITMYMEVFSQTRNIELPLKMFNVGLYAGLASLFYFPYIIFLPVGCISVLYLRTFKTKDFTRATIGALVPYILLATVVYLTDHLGDLLKDHFVGNFALLDMLGYYDWKDYVIIGIYAMTSIIALATANSFGRGLNIHVRKKISVIFLSLVSAILLTVFVVNTDVSSLLFLSVPLAVLMGAMFLSLEKQFAEILHFILFVTALLFQYVV